MDTLSNLKVGEKAIIYKLKNSDDIRRRLQDIGLVEGTEVSCIQRSPCGDPVAYNIRGALIAIRLEDSDKILIY